MTGRTKLGIAALAFVLVAVVVVTVLLALPRGGSPQARPSATPDVTQIASVDGAWTPVCGFPGQLISKVVAVPERGDPEPDVLVEELALGDSTLIALLASAYGFAVETMRPDGALEFELFDPDGAAIDTVTVDFARNEFDPPNATGSAAFGDDGSIWVIDGSQGRHDLVRFSPEGARTATITIPASSADTSSPFEFHNAIWVADYDGSAAVLVHEAERATHVFREDGTYVERRDGLIGVIGPVDASAVATVRTQSSTDFVEIVTASTGAPLATWAPTEEGGSGFAEIGAIAPGPDGSGYVVFQREWGLEWLDDVGVRKGVWLAQQDGMDAVERLVWDAATGAYLLLGRDADTLWVIRLSPAQLHAQIERPVDLKAVLHSSIASLGIGVAPMTGVEYGHFDDGQTPRAWVDFAPGWGVVGDTTPGERYEISYTVTGDPLLAEPIVQEARSASVALGGGEVALDLPTAQPGLYEVSIALRDRTTDQDAAATCLRYSVSAPGADLDFGTLSEGADWGGPDPLRGVELADRLGVGSHRVQLDFTALVPEPASAPDRARVNWNALPGILEGENVATGIDADFSQLVAAADLARRNGTTLIVQVGRGGEGENRAVDAGTWEGWVEVLVREIAERTGIRHFSPWNEPNQAMSGDAYAQLVSIPFANAAHAAAPGSIVIAGNTLGFAYDFWAEAVGAGICDAVDAIGVHPYTGWNRSWEEQGFAVDGAGFDELRAMLGADCAQKPIWDTETGFTSDGAAAFWAQGANVARKLLWYQHSDVAGWTYFFSEGGWGESDLSWSLLQVSDYVKPGALAFATVSQLLDGRGAGETLDTGIPFSYATRFAGDDELTAVWTDDMRTMAVVVADAPDLTVIDQYGAERRLELVDGRADLTITGSPQFLRAPAGTSLTFEAPEPFGDDVLAGRPVEVSSTHDTTHAAVITSGTVNVDRAWRSGRLPGGGIDEAPYVEVALDSPRRLDRVAVATASILCCEAGLRDYTVSVRTPEGEWVVVAEHSGQFFERVAMFEFDAIEADAVRIDIPWTQVRGVPVLAVNYSGQVGGLPSPFMGLRTDADFVVAVSALSAWEQSD